MVKVNEGIPVRRHSVCEGVEVGSCRVLSGDGDYTVRDRRGGTDNYFEVRFPRALSEKGCELQSGANWKSLWLLWGERMKRDLTGKDTT